MRGYFFALWLIGPCICGEDSQTFNGLEDGQIWLTEFVVMPYRKWWNRGYIQQTMLGIRLLDYQRWMRKTSYTRMMNLILEDLPMLSLTHL